MRTADGPAPPPAGLPTRYRLGGPVGRGSSATVWSARDTRAGVDVVVKVLDREGASPERFDAEARALGRLGQVGGVVAVRAVGRCADGRPWLVEDLVQGSTLADRLRSAPWPVGEVRRLVRQVAATLAATHASGVVHGDVAPGNVLCRVDGTYLLCDFGVAVLGGTSDRPAPCTPSFAAPERRAGGPPTRAADVYGLAVLGWYALTGGLPPEVVPVRGGGLPRSGPALARALGSALDPDPRRRPTAAAVARRAR